MLGLENLGNRDTIRTTNKQHESPTLGTRRQTSSMEALPREWHGEWQLASCIQQLRTGMVAFPLQT